MSVGAGLTVAFCGATKLANVKSKAPKCPKCSSPTWHFEEGEDDGVPEDSPYGGPKKSCDFWMCDECWHAEVVE